MLIVTPFSRNEKLWGLLPDIDAPYDYHTLSRVETDALVEALGDGFGDRGVQGQEPLPLPSNLNSGLLEHAFYSDSGYDADDWGFALPDSGYDADDWGFALRTFPLGFIQTQLRIYFQNQFYRFCKRIARENAVSLDNKRAVFEELAYQRVYEKPWYEAQALNFLDIVYTSTKNLKEDQGRFLRLIGKRALDPSKCQVLVIAAFAGQLGRLVEQYYWRFRFERAVVAGESARKGASAGGKIKAERYRTKHSAWQNEASRIWAHRPDLGKHAVGEIIRKQLGEACTAKHIARCITHS
jgi:hypothetical protein